MVTGRVVAADEILKPIVEILVYGQPNARARVQVVVDTGFTEQLTLPKHAIDALKLRFEFEEKLTMANNEPITFDAYTALIEWNGRTREVKVYMADGDPLIGMAILRDHDLHIRAIPNGSISITPVD